MVRRELCVFRDLIECCSGRLNRTVLVVVVGLPFDLCVAAASSEAEGSSQPPIKVENEVVDSGKDGTDGGKLPEHPVEAVPRVWFSTRHHRSHPRHSRRQTWHNTSRVGLHRDPFISNADPLVPMNEPSLSSRPLLEAPSVHLLQAGCPARLPT